MVVVSENGSNRVFSSVLFGRLSFGWVGVFVLKCFIG